MAGPIPQDIKKIVVFLFVERPAAGIVPNGTGFFVGVPDPKDKTRSFVYLVTARHVISQTPFGALYPKAYVRLSKRAGGTEGLELPLAVGGPDRTVFFHPDPTVDLAVIPALPKEDKYDFMILPEELVTTKEKFEELKISEGSEVFFAGLFTPFLGQERNYPVVRFGRVALITPEKIPWSGRNMDLYLVESSSYGGNSGSPVFFYLGADRVPGSIVVGPPQLFLAGVMMGAFQDLQPLQALETDKTAVSRSNIGISAVVPAFRLHELLFSPDLEARRQRK